MSPRLPTLTRGHPSSSVNGVFTARNAVGRIFSDGAKDYSAKDHSMAWIQNDVPPGMTYSPYKAIHHNFSRDTPPTIQSMMDNWVFPMGPEDDETAPHLTSWGSFTSRPTAEPPWFPWCSTARVFFSPSDPSSSAV